MEKRKLLLIAISVGIFLVIAIGAALLVFAPKNTAVTSRTETGGTGQTVITVTPPPQAQPVSPVADTHGSDNTRNVPSTPVDAVDMVRKPGDIPGLKTPPEGSVRQGTDYYVNGSAQSGQNVETVISIPKPSTAAVPNTQAEGRAVSAPAPKPAPAVSAAPAAVAAAKPAAPASSQSKPAVNTKIYDDYWVQTGAFAAATTAEVVKASLASKGITSIIENRNVDGKTLYRVRVGPYTSKNEAEYWLSLIKTIGGFEDSQVRQTQSRR